MSARITVIIPVFRAADTIGAAIESVLGQTVPCNVVVVDDASGDATLAACKAADDGSGRLTLLEQTINQGPAAARNVALRQAQTPWVALLDSDDRMAPDRMERLLAIAEHSQWDIVADDLIRVSGWDADADHSRLWSDTDFGEIHLNLARFVRENIFTYSGHGRELGYLKPLMRREALAAEDLFYNEAMRLGEDFDLYARALLAGLRFGLVDPLGYYALNRPGSLSKMHTAQDLRAAWEASCRLARDPRAHEEDRLILAEHRQLLHKKWAWVRLIEAVRTRDPLEAAGAFLAPPSVIGELLKNLRAHFQPRTTHIIAGSS